MFLIHLSGLFQFFLNSDSHIFISWWHQCQRFLEVFDRSLVIFAEPVSLGAAEQRLWCPLVSQRHRCFFCCFLVLLCLEEADWHVQECGCQELPNLLGFLFGSFRVLGNALLMIISYHSLLAKVLVHFNLLRFGWQYCVSESLHPRILGQCPLKITLLEEFIALILVLESLPY